MILDRKVGKLIKASANEFSNQAQWSQNPFGWFPVHPTSKVVRLLGPLSIIKELDNDLWCTLVLLPRSSSEVLMRCDFYTKEGRVTPLKTIEKWKWMLNQEWMSKAKLETEEDSMGSQNFAYQCGGKCNRPISCWGRR